MHDLVHNLTQSVLIEINKFKEADTKLAKIVERIYLELFLQVFINLYVWLDYHSAVVHCNMLLELKKLRALSLEMYYVTHLPIIQ